MKIKPTIGYILLASVIIGEIDYFCTMPWRVLLGFALTIIVMALFTWLMWWLFKEDIKDEAE